MQLVNDRWYVLYSHILVGLALFCLVFSLGGMYVPSLEPLAVKAGFSIVIAVLSGALLLFRILAFPFMVRRYGRMAAVMMLNLIFTLILITFIHTTGKLHSLYHIGWGLTVLANGMFGPYVIVGYAALTTIYLLLIITDVPGKVNFDPVSLLGVLFIYIVGVIGYFIWKRAYASGESAKIAQLSGALKSKELQSEILLQSIADGVIVVDNNNMITIINPAAALMTGWSPQEALGINANDVVLLRLEDGKDLDANKNPFTQVAEQKQQVSQVLQIASRDGNTKIVSVIVSPVILPQSANTIGYIAVLRDVSAARAEEAKRAEFISTASHEMRTPVAAIEGYLALAMNDKVSNIDNKARGFLEKAHTSTQHLGKLFQDLLTSAKAEDGRLVSHPVVVDIGEFLDQVTESLRFSAEKKGLLIDYMVGASPGADSNAVGNKVVRPLYYVYADPDRLREVITNLFDNAVKYTETGKITIGLTGNNDVVQVFVKDTGPGIPAADVPHLFQKFYRVDSTATRTIGGTGLGLFICKMIIELYQGRIWAESEVGKGSTFYINLPRLSSQKASELLLKQSQSSTPVNTLTTPLV